MSNNELAKHYFSVALVEYANKNYEEAIENLKTALDYAPDRLSILTNLTAIYIKLSKFEDAIKIIEKIYNIYPNDYVTLLNQGNIYEKQSRFTEAVTCYSNSLKINSEYTEALFNRANILTLFNRLVEALNDYEKAYLINPEYKYLLGTIIHTRMFLCIWKNFDENLKKLINEIKDGKKTTPCFPLLALTDSLELQLQVAKIRVKDLYPIDNSLGEIINTKKKRIRIGYFSADFHNHATSYLMAQLFEMHDKKKYEVFAFSFGPDKQDEMRLRLIKCFEHFYEISKYTSKEIAVLSRNLGIDIAVDLKGHTLGHRLDIFSFRAAPIQISYLGYPGTSGASYIDYVIADRTLIPENSEKFYTEKIIYMPESYQVNDNSKIISNINFSRVNFGLPDNKFVYCCFNNNFKILPFIFESWLNILNRVPNSVLWLLKDNLVSQINIINTAKEKGFDTNRIIFADRVELDIHLARHRLADVFLDTFPYNAHTTTSDALWAGLPVITRTGESFASRVAASLLNSIGLNELVASNQNEYENIAVDLAKNVKKIQFIKNKLNYNLKTTSLFDTQKFTKNIEEAYKNVYEIYKSGKPIESFYV
jgi:predicted O-linked N-acetylglucosamine transferase (SPINDLY family)